MKKVIKFLKSIIISASKGIYNDPEMQKLMKRCPRFFRFLERRFTRDEERGLYLTVGSVITGIFIYFFLGIVKDIIGQDLIIQADLRIVNLVQIFRTPSLNSSILFITYLGSWQVVFLGVSVVSLILFFLKQGRQLAALVSSVVGGEIFIWIIKNAVARPRPPLVNALAPVQDYSFPSGHSFVALSFYGLLTYFLVRSFKSKLIKILLIILGVLLILLIGMSRIYLGVHWASDVLASYAIGAAWLTGFVTFIEIRKKYRPKEKEIPYLKKSKIIIVSIILISGWILYLDYYFNSHPIRPQGVISSQSGIMIKADPVQNLFSSFSRTSENLSGESMEPIDIVIIAREDKLLKTFEDASWRLTDKISAKTTAKLIYTSLLNKPYPQAPGVPTFWNREPNDFAYEKPTSQNTVRERHHIHFWKTPYVFSDGRQVWVATAHFDKGVNLTSSIILPTHVIDPAIDRERDQINQDLLNTGMVESSNQIQIVEPTLGTNQSGNQFFTDGKADLIFLKN
jgi:membrane-associated phospholipid phosphatase